MATNTVLLAGVNRPAFGASGKSVQVVSNFYKMQIAPSKQVHLYSCEFHPELPPDASNSRPKIIEQSKEFVRRTTGCIDLIASGGNVYLLGGNGTPLVEFDYEVNGLLYNIKLKLNRALAFQADNITHPEQALYFNIIIKKALRELRFQTIGRYQYDASHLIRVNSSGNQGELNLFPGYFISVSLNASKLTLNVDIKHRILQPQTVLELITRMRGQGAAPADIDSAITGRVVLTRCGSFCLCYRVRSIEWNMSSDDVFLEKREGKEISYRTYFAQRYNIRLNAARSPLIRVEQKRGRSTYDVFLPSEICQITGLDDNIRNNFTVMNAIAQTTRMLPQARFNKCLQAINRLQQDKLSKTVLDTWGVQVSNVPIKISARQMNSQHFQVVTTYNDAMSVMKGNGAGRFGTPINFSRINFPHIVDKGVIGFTNNEKCLYDLKRWVIVATERDIPAVMAFAQNLSKAASAYKLSIAKPITVGITSNRLNDFTTQLQSAMTGQYSAAEFVLIALPNVSNISQLYSNVKKVLSSTNIGLGIASQCIKMETITKKAEKAMTKLCHQIICKLGGSLWTVPSIFTVPTLCIGIDVLSSGGKNWVSMCSNVNNNFITCYSRCEQIANRNNVASCLGTFLKGAVNNYRMKNNTAPSRVIIYRDGLSEAQKSLSSSLEIEAMEIAFKEMNITWASTVEKVYISVNKDINQRFGISIDNNMLMEMSRNKHNNRGPVYNIGDIINPSPLTVIDSGITASNKFDFYVVHQEVTQGCVTPTHYDILLWMTKMTVDDIQIFTSQLSMLYQNWPGPIRVPSYVMNAKKLSALCAATGATSHQKLENLLHQL